MTPGGLVAFLGYLGMITRPVSYLTRSLNLLQQAVGRRAAQEPPAGAPGGCNGTGKPARTG